MLQLFAESNDVLMDSLDKIAVDATPQLPKTRAEWAGWKSNPALVPAGVVDMEERFCSVSLDIIGRAVFNYDFASTTAESPVVQAVYRRLKEAEFRTTAFVPYWELPGASMLPSQRAFRRDQDLLNAI